MIKGLIIGTGIVVILATLGVAGFVWYRKSQGKTPQEILDEIKDLPKEVRDQVLVQIKKAWPQANKLDEALNDPIS